MSQKHSRPGASFLRYNHNDGGRISLVTWDEVAINNEASKTT